MSACPIIYEGQIEHHVNKTSHRCFVGDSLYLGKIYSFAGLTREESTAMKTAREAMPTPRPM